MYTCKSPLKGKSEPTGYWGERAVLLQIFTVLWDLLLRGFIVLVGSHFKELQIAEGGVSPLKTVTFFNRSCFEDAHICGVLPKS